MSELRSDIVAVLAQKNLRRCTNPLLDYVQRRRYIISTSALPLCLPDTPTTLLPLSNFNLMACPFNDGYRFQLLDICLSFTRTARRWGLNHSLLPSLINWRLSVSGDMKKSFPVLRIWLLICTLKYSFVDNLSIRKLNIS